MNPPWAFKRETLCSPRTTEQARKELGDALANGVEIEGVRRRLFGYAEGDRFSLSFGAPLIDGGSPVVRGRLVPNPNGTDVRLAVGMRIERIVIIFVLLAMGLGFGGYQIARELGSGPAGDRLNAALQVLPRMAIFLVPALLGLWWGRTKVLAAAPILIETIAVYLDCSGPDHSRPEAIE